AGPAVDQLYAKADVLDEHIVVGRLEALALGGIRRGAVELGLEHLRGLHAPERRAVDGLLDEVAEAAALDRVGYMRSRGRRAPAVRRAQHLVDCIRVNKAA